MLIILSLLLTFLQGPAFAADVKDGAAAAVTQPDMSTPRGEEKLDTLKPIVINWVLEKPDVEDKLAKVREFLQQMSHEDVETITLYRETARHYNIYLAQKIHAVLEAVKNKGEFPKLKMLDLGGFEDWGSKSVFVELVDACYHNPELKIIISYLVISGKEVAQGTATNFSAQAQSSFPEVRSVTIRDVSDDVLPILMQATGNLTKLTMLGFENVSPQILIQNLDKLPATATKIILYKGLHLFKDNVKNAWEKIRPGVRLEVVADSKSLPRYK